MKIAMLQTPMFPLDPACCGGVERVELCELEHLNKLGYEVKLYVPELIGNNEDIIAIKDLNWKNRLLKFYYYLNFGFKTRRFDLYHGHYTPILALLYPDKSVIHYHGQAVFMLPKYGMFKKRYHKAHYMFNSKSTMKAFVGAYPDVPQEHLHLLYNAVDTDQFMPAQRGNRPDLSGQVSMAKICFCGRWTEEKGIFVLLEAIKFLEQKRKDFKLYLIGSAHIPVKTEKSELIEKKVKETAGKLSTVEITGPVEHEKLPDLYQQMDIGVVPSVWEEPFGLVILEMMASGLPVIASRVGAIPEIMEDNVNGLLVEPNKPEALAQRMELLLNDRMLRLKLDQAARKHVERKFTWEKHLEELLKVYGKVTENNE
ncbi:MAG: glycosyltransferase family 4 protein [Candidatus Margulisiibacteriota bacterium]